MAMAVGGIRYRGLRPRHGAAEVQQHGQQGEDPGDSAEFHSRTLGRIGLAGNPRAEA